MTVKIERSLNPISYLPSITISDKSMSLTMEMSLLSEAYKGLTKEESMDIVVGKIRRLLQEGLEQDV